MDTMKTVKYAKVSTADQSCEMHVSERQDYSWRRGLKLVAHHRAKGEHSAFRSLQSGGGRTQVRRRPTGAEQFGHEIGDEVRFAPDDFRAMATDVMNGSKDGQS